MTGVDCPVEGCRTVQLMAKQLTDAVEQATECIEKTADQHQSLLITLTRMETVLTAQMKQMESLGPMIVDIAILKSSKQADGVSGAKTVGISGVISGAVIALVEYIKIQVK